MSTVSAGCTHFFPIRLAENELALLTGRRLLSSYALPNGGEAWIISEADRSITTILLPEGY